MIPYKGRNWHLGNIAINKEKYGVYDLTMELHRPEVIITLNGNYVTTSEEVQFMSTPARQKTPAEKIQRLIEELNTIKEAQAINIEERDKAYRTHQRLAGAVTNQNVSIEKIKNQINAEIKKL